MQDIQEDIDSAAAHQHESEGRRQAEGWEWWPAYHQALCERQKLERASFAALERAIREWLHE